MGNKITSRKEDYSKWYNDIVINADLAENSEDDEFSIDSIKVASEGSDDDFQTIIKINKNEENKYTNIKDSKHIVHFYLYVLTQELF